MSIQALAWVFEQNIPSRAKNVLFALANHADHVTGHCFPSIATIMREASCSRRATFNYLGALRRNGFIDIRQVRRDDGRLRSSDYWLLFDRAPGVWKYSKEDSVEENSTDGFEDQENSEVDSALCAPYPAAVENAADEPAGAPYESSLCTTIIEPSDSNHQNLESKDRRPVKFDRPQEFSSQAQAEQIAKLQAADEARKPQRIPVIEGSKPWESWVRHGHSRNLVNNISLNGRIHRGWWFPSLYPPKQSTGPPPLSALMTSEDEKAI